MKNIFLVLNLRFTDKSSDLSSGKHLIVTEDKVKIEKSPVGNLAQKENKNTGEKSLTRELVFAFLSDDKSVKETAWNQNHVFVFEEVTFKKITFFVKPSVSMIHLRWRRIVHNS